MRGHIYLHHMAFYEKGKKLSVQLFLEYKQGWKFTKPTIHVVRKETFFLQPDLKNKHKYFGKFWNEME